MHKFMKMAGVKNEKDFYKKYPTEDHFFAAFPNMMEKGGPIKNQWDLPSDPSTPGYEDYGDMYTVPQWPGLMYKDPGMSGWEGFGNPANLASNQGVQDMGYGPVRDMPTRQLAMDPSDYSIDRLRASQMKDGGYSNPPGMYWNGTSYVKAKGTGTYANGTYFKDGGKFNYNPFIRKNGNYWTYLDYIEDGGNIAQLKQGGPIGYVPANINAQPQILKQTDGVYHMEHGGAIEYIPAPMTVHPRILKRTNGVAHMREGGINNPGFNALPVAVQEKIKARMEFGGVHMPTPIKKDGGYWKYYGYDEDGGNIAELKEGGIHIKPSKRGTFTAAATKHGKSVQAFASQVLANKENYSPAMVKKANFARNASKWQHEYGGSTMMQDGGMTMQLVTDADRQAYNNYIHGMRKLPGYDAVNWQHDETFQKNAAQQLGFDYSKAAAIQADMMARNEMYPGTIKGIQGSDPWGGKPGWVGDRERQKEYKKNEYEQYDKSGNLIGHIKPTFTPLTPQQYNSWTDQNRARAYQPDLPPTTNPMDPAYVAPSAPQAAPRATGLAATGFPTREEAIAKYQARKASGQELPSNYFLEDTKKQKRMKETGDPIGMVRLTGEDVYAYGGPVDPMDEPMPQYAMGGHMNPFSAIAQFAYGGYAPIMQGGGGEYAIGQYVEGKGYWDGSTFLSSPPGVTSDQISPEGSQAVILNAPSSTTPTDAFKANSPYDTTVYNPQTDPNNPVNNPPPMPPQGGYAAAQGPVYEGRMEQQPQMIAGTEYSRKRPKLGPILGGLIGGIATGAGIVSAAKRNIDARKNDINRGGSWNMASVQGSKGTMPNVNRMSGPGSVISQPGNFSPYRAQMGGMMARNNMYQEGGVYDMDDAEIADLIAKGYKVQYV